MVPSATPTNALLKEIMPTRDEKRILAKRLGLGESLMYKWCREPEPDSDSGRPNPLDLLEVLLDHARLYHPHAAFAIATRIQAGNARAVGRGAVAMPTPELLTEIQPGTEKETTEALHALSGAIRELLLGKQVDLTLVLREVEQAEGELKRARLMLAAAVDAAKRAEEDE